MVRTIAAASIVFAFVVFALHHTSGSPFTEPLLLLVMGSLFLVVGKLFSRDPQSGELVEREA